MSLAEEIRNLFQLPEEFFNKYAIPSLRAGGRFSVVSGRHVGEIVNYAIPEKYEHSLVEWAMDNGFNVGYHYNSYGVKHVDITI